VPEWGFGTRLWLPRINTMASQRRDRAQPTQQTDPLDDEWLKPSEVAELLQIGVPTLHKLARQGRGPVYLQVSENIRRFRRSDVNAWIEENMQNGRVVYPPFPPSATEVLYGAPGRSSGRRRRLRWWAVSASDDPIHQLVQRLLIFATSELLRETNPALSDQLRSVLDASRGAACANPKIQHPRAESGPQSGRPSHRGEEQAVDGERPILFKHPDQLLTKAEFCKWAGVSQRTLSQWIRDGSAPRRMRFGNHVRIRWSDALAWAESRYVND
jgi:excisionase family DNA binding protein